MSLSFRPSNLDVLGAGALARGEPIEGVRLEHPAPWKPGTPLGQHLRIERLVRVLEGKHVYLANNVDPLWRHKKCWACGNRYNPNMAQSCTYCRTPLTEERFLATVRHDGTHAAAWEAFMRKRVRHPALCTPVAAFYRESRPVTVFAYHGERLLSDQPAPIPAAILVTLSHRLAVALEAVHARGVMLHPISTSNVVLMPDGTARFIDLEADQLLDRSGLAKHPDRPILADVRHLCRMLGDLADPEDEALVGFFRDGAAGKHGPPRRFRAALEHFHERLAGDRHDVAHAGYSDLGLTRLRNEDRWGWRRFDARTALYVVADGMGGHQKGADAATRTVHGVLEHISEGLAATKLADGPLKKLMETAVVAANTEVLKASSRGARAMGATVVALMLVDGKKGYVVHAGDARAYVQRGKDLKRVTTDHSLVQAMVERGTITPEEARNHPKSNVILNYVGQDEEVEVDVTVVDTRVGDRWLLCSDGLWGELDDPHLASHLMNWREPRRCVQRLVHDAYEAGGKDNITTVVVDVTG